jgi:hypothetical protein
VCTCDGNRFASHVLDVFPRMLDVGWRKMKSDTGHCCLVLTFLLAGCQPQPTVVSTDERDAILGGGPKDGDARFSNTSNAQHNGQQAPPVATNTSPLAVPPPPPPPPPTAVCPSVASGRCTTEDLALSCRYPGGRICSCRSLCQGIRRVGPVEYEWACEVRDAACPEGVPNGGGPCPRVNLECSYGTCGGWLAKCGANQQWAVRKSAPPG